MQIKLEIFETTMSFVNSCTANFQIIYTYPRTGKVIESAGPLVRWSRRKAIEAHVIVRDRRQIRRQQNGKVESIKKRTIHNIKLYRYEIK